MLDRKLDGGMVQNNLHPYSTLTDEVSDLGIPNPDLSRFIQMADGDAETIDTLRQIQSFESHGPYVVK